MTATFLGMAQDLMLDADAKAAFEADPDGFLVAHGFDGLSPEDVADAVGFVAETLPPGPAQVLADPEAGGDALARLAQVDPGAVVDADAPPDEADTGDFGRGHTGDDDEDEDREADDEDEDEDEDDDEETIVTDPAPDPTELPDDGTGYTAFRDDELDPSFGVGYGNEDVDDASPADHGGEPPDLGLHF